MPEPHAVIYLTNELVQVILHAFLPKWRLTGAETLNDLWLQNGLYHYDVYAYGEISRWSYRQLRGHGFIFVSTRKRIKLADGEVEVDILLKSTFIHGTTKQLETEIGRRRLRLRKGFGDILRKYAFMVSKVLNGSEAETLNDADYKIHRVCGLPAKPPVYGDGCEISYRRDGGTDEKLVSMLDYMIYSANEIHYVGCGDLRTLLKFKKRSEKRFNQVEWHVYDKIVKYIDLPNVRIHNHFVYKASDIMKNVDVSKKRERLLIWDVSTDRIAHTNLEWDAHRGREDRLGEVIATELEGMFALALIKHRIPTNIESYRCVTSHLIPQPGAPHDMFELRNVIRLSGFSWVDRTHIPAYKYINVCSETCRKMVVKYHGTDRGKELKKRLFEYLHIERVNGLHQKNEESRSDLFYLTNVVNKNDVKLIDGVVKTSMISTLWVSKRELYDYEDFPFERNEIMLRFSSRERRVFDGNGAVLFLLWNYPHIFTRNDHYDPSWAMNFAVIMREPVPDPPVPDVSLCRFIGLRAESSQLRLNSPSTHEASDVVKELGLDLSGHLYVTLMCNGYIADLMWWFAMILKWSAQDRDKKMYDLKISKATIIEWKEEMASKPWHVKNDLIGALREFGYQKKQLEPQALSWIEALRMT
ncbi:capping enzyme [Changuinola virus]|uniref:Core protein VP4 n=1 Tax=Changuinola virus TaxID=40052 RepID=U5NXR5_9REOV|nr:capping enzyme [Changuinola virus]AGY34645.1 capping enzyme [Changuinola virus]